MYETCGDGSIDVTGREIKVRKSVENKGFPGVGTVWMAVSIPGFFAFGKSVGTGLRQKMAESRVDRLDIGYVVETGLIKRVPS